MFNHFKIQIISGVIGICRERLSENLDAQGVSIANMRAQEETTEARKLKRAAQKESEEIATSMKDLITVQESQVEGDLNIWF